VEARTIPSFISVTSAHPQLAISLWPKKHNIYKRLGNISDKPLSGEGAERISVGGLALLQKRGGRKSPIPKIFPLLSCAKYLLARDGLLEHGRRRAGFSIDNVIFLHPH
jgi:hypothetical protein